jgi:hypothetical protein
VTLQDEETLLFYSDGLLHRTGEDTDRAFALLHATAAAAPAEVRRDPEALADHVLRAVLPADAQLPSAPGSTVGPYGGRADGHPEDVVLLAARF